MPVEWLAKPVVAALESQSKLSLPKTTTFRLNYGPDQNPIAGARCHPQEICLSRFEIKNQAFLKKDYQLCKEKVPENKILE